MAALSDDVTLALANRIADFQEKLRGLTRNHTTERAMRIIDFKVPPFQKELFFDLGLDVTIETTISRHGVVVTGTIKEE